MDQGCLLSVQKTSTINEKFEEAIKIQGQELLRFLQIELDLVEIEVALSETAVSAEHRMQARQGATRALEIVGRFTPQLKDEVLVRGIQNLAAHYRRMLAGETA
jgi:hypothetical protein